MFQGLFLPKIESQVLEIDDWCSHSDSKRFGTAVQIETTTGHKFFNAYTHDKHHRSYNTKGWDKQEKKVRGYVHEDFGKTRIDPEGLTRETLKPNTSVVTDKENLTKHKRHIYKQTCLQRGFKRGAQVTDD